ncbi:hypothetical protein GCM10029963_45290 [Micromonospora andamanensis]
MLGGGVLVAQRAGDLLGGTDGVDELAGQGRLGDAGAPGGGQRVDGPLGGPAQLGRVGPDGAQQAGSGGALGVQQRQQQVPRLNRGVAPLVRQGDSAGDGLAALGGEAFGVHGLPWIGVSTGTDRTRVEPIPLNP